jgi:hypothetical protein
MTQGNQAEEYKRTFSITLQVDTFHRVNEIVHSYSKNEPNFIRNQLINRWIEAALKREARREARTGG